MRNTKIDFSHFTLRDRIYIQFGLQSGLSISKIARHINFSRQRVYDEIKVNALTKDGHHGQFYPSTCDKLIRYPFVCNTCPLKYVCRRKKRYYYADEAEKKARKRLIRSRTGSQLSPIEIQAIDDLVKAPLLSGQSIHHVYTLFEEHLPLCERSLRHLVNRGELFVKNGHLRRTVNRRVYKKEYLYPAVKDPEILLGRTYADYLDEVPKHSFIAQLDTLHGKRSDAKCLLTIYFPTLSFMFGFLLEKKTPEEVNHALLSLREKLGLDLYKKLFPVLLTDRGLEFNHLPKLEVNEHGELLSKVYYADPYRSNQKAEIESAHRLVRYLLPKGKSLDQLTKDDVKLVFSSVNAIIRTSLKDLTPYELATKALSKEVISLLGVSYLNPKSIILKSILTKKSD